MNKNIIMAGLVILLAIGGAYFILKPEAKVINTVQSKVQDESQPHSHDE